MRRLLLGVGLALGACASISLPEPTLRDAGGRPERLEALRAGRALYRDKCSGCHPLHAPEEYSDAEWPRHVDAMIRNRKAALTAEQRAALIDYLSAVNARD